MASITGDTLQEQIQKAISAHGVFKFKLAHMVEAETGEIQPLIAGADYHCPVGKWLYESVPPEARGEHYRTVVELHAHFHRAAGEVAALSVARRRTEALEAMELTSSFKKTSDQLVQALEAWAGAAVSGEAVAAGEALEASQPEEAAQGELPAGWWLDSPDALVAEAKELAPGHEQEAEPVESDGAEEQAALEPAEVEGETHISDWFGLPKSLGGDGSDGEGRELAADEEPPEPVEGGEAREPAADEEPPEPVEGDEAREPADGNPEETQD